MNKEERRKAYQKEYYKKWKENNKDYYKGQGKDGYQYVYLLEDYNYVGCTNSISNRFKVHKCENDRDCTNHRILYKTKDRSEAFELEALLHDIGYEGKHANNSYN